MNQFDDSQYSLDELQDARRHIDRSVLPDRAINIDRWIAIRSSALRNTGDRQELPEPWEIEASKRDGRILATIDLDCDLRGRVSCNGPSQSLLSTSCCTAWRSWCTASGEVVAQLNSSEMPACAM